MTQPDSQDPARPAAPERPGEPRVLLVELGDSHGEVLIPQVEALRRASIPTGLVVNRALAPRLHPSVTAHTQVHEVDVGSGIARVRTALSIRRRILRDGWSHVVINTASGNAVQALATVLPRSVPVTGILHDVARLERSSRQRVISRRVRHYLVLADHLVPELPGDSPLRIRSWYPIRRPGTEPHAPTPPASGQPLHFVVPGRLDPARRDYDRLVELLQHADPSGADAVHVTLLGDCTRGCGPALMETLRGRRLLDRVTTCEGFVSEEEFYRVAEGCDAILPLLHLDGPGRDAYLADKIAGGFNLAYGLRKPMIVHPDVGTHPDLAAVGIVLRRRPDGGVRLPSRSEFDAEADRVRRAYATLPRFDPALQDARYLDVVLRSDAPASPSPTLEP